MTNGSPNSGEIYGAMWHIEGLPKNFHWVSIIQTFFYPMDEAWDDLNVINSYASCYDIDRSAQADTASLEGNASDSEDGDFGYCDIKFVC